MTEEDIIHVAEEDEIFFVRTKDGTEFSIYNLVISGKDQQLEFEFGFGAVETGIDKHQYEDEIEQIMRDIMKKVIEGEFDGGRDNYN